jgi:hypothetical protein
MTQMDPMRDNRGNTMARCTCDECDETITIKCNFVTREGDHRPTEVNRSQATVKLNDAGWTLVKNVLRCPSCESLRKEKRMSKEPTVVSITATPPRQPTREQKRMIVTALEEMYDTQNQRYKGTETDKGIAEMLGDNIMSGWVSIVREDMFGPDGNEEMLDFSKEIAAWMKKVDDNLAIINLALSEIEGARAEAKKYQDRLSKIVVAIGPKAEKTA